MNPIPVPCPHCGAVLKVRDSNLLGRKAKCPKCDQAFRIEEPAALTTAAVTVSARNQQVAPANSRGNAETGLPAWPTDDVPVSAAVQRQASRKIVGSCAGVVALLLAGLAAVYVSQSPLEPPADPDAQELAEDDLDAAAIQAILAGPEAQPIELKYIPAGSRIVVNLRPAELWQPDSKGEEFRYCLGPISEFLAARIKDLAKREPAEIEEALFCLIPNERGTPPDVAAVFHLKDEARKSQLLDEFGGRRSESQGGTPYYISGERAYLFPDLQTIATCPARLVDEMVDAVEIAQPTSEGIVALLSQTDRAKPMTVIFEPVSTKIDAEFLLPPAAIPLLDQFCEWLGPDVETGGWSLGWDKNQFRSELLVRNKGSVESKALAKQLRQQLGTLAKDILHVVEQFSPKEMGKRKVIGRFPAMMRAFTLATHTEAGPRVVKFATQLPERAAPNLALGALLAWDESTRTTLKGKSSAGDDDKDKPDNTPIAEKLKRKVSVEFNREPLQGAFTYIANEIKAKLDIDGDALKLSAYTKNMPQTFTLDNVPATDALWEILQKYDKMCLVVDEQKNVLLITTYPVAEQKGLKPFDFPKK
jgi:predicted Zn finger-like uncharacterized protein